MVFVNSPPQVTVSENNDPPLVGSWHDEYEYWRPFWKRLRDVLLSEDTIKEAGEEYLPKLDGQNAEEYEAYKSRSVFFPAASRTLDGLMGNIFQREPKINNVPSQIDLRNISYEGFSLLEFVKEGAREVLSVGRIGLLVDRPEGEDPRLKPYLAGYTAEQIINWRLGIRLGRTFLEQVILYEVREVAADSGFGTDYLHQYRVLEINSEGQYQQRVFDADKDGKVENSTPRIIIPHYRGKPLDFIPFYFIGTRNLSPRISKPPLLDIANMNISHYISYADLEEGRHFTALPTYWISGPGADEDTEFFVGSRKVWLLDENDRAGMLEFNGQGLIFLENAITMKEQQMALLGARIIGQPRRVAAEAADTTQLRQKGEQSILLDITDTMNEGFSYALRTLVWWSDVPGFSAENLEEVSIELNQDFSDGETTPRELRVMQQLYEGGIIPLEVVFNVFKSAGVVPTYMSFPEFKKMLDDASQQSEKGNLNNEETAAKIKKLEAETKKLKEEAKVAGQPPVQPSFGGTRIGVPPVSR